MFCEISPLLIRVLADSVNADFCVISQDRVMRDRVAIRRDAHSVRVGRPK